MPAKHFSILVDDFGDDDDTRDDDDDENENDCFFVPFKSERLLFVAEQEVVVAVKLILIVFFSRYVRVKVCVCVCITIKCVVYKHERQKVKRYYPDDLIAKRIEREKEKKCKRGATRKQEKHTQTPLPARERKERKK